MTFGVSQFRLLQCSQHQWDLGVRKRENASHLAEKFGLYLQRSCKGFTRDDALEVDAAMPRDLRLGDAACPGTGNTAPGPAQSQAHTPLSTGSAPVQGMAA